MYDYLLTGGNGTLGTELQKHLNCFAPSSSALNVTNFRDDWRDEHGLIPYMGSVERFRELYEEELSGVEAVIHSAAWTDVPGAEIDKGPAVHTNIMGSQNMAKFAHDHGMKFIYISTDYVYPGHSGNAAEDSKTEPFNFYGFTKLAGESFAELENDLVIRTSFKPNDLWETKYNKAFIDIYTSADYADVIAKDIAFAIDQDLSGIYNIGTERKSIFELATSRYPDVEELDSWEVATLVKMPHDISMNIDKYNNFKNEHLEEFDTFISGGSQ